MSNAGKTERATRDFVMGNKGNIARLLGQKKKWFLVWLGGDEPVFRGVEALEEDIDDLPVHLDASISLDANLHSCIQQIVHGTHVKRAAMVR